MVYYIVCGESNKLLPVICNSFHYLGELFQLIDVVVE